MVTCQVDSQGNTPPPSHLKAGGIGLYHASISFPTTTGWGEIHVHKTSLLQPRNTTFLKVGLVSAAVLWTSCSGIRPRRILLVRFIYYASIMLACNGIQECGRA